MIKNDRQYRLTKAQLRAFDVALSNIEAQVFQNAACNWRCWYCYVPFSLLAASRERSSWMTAADLLDMYENVERQPKIIDLSGGQPDLTPEWIPWMMEELQRRSLSESIYLWSDDNLSNDYFWRFLTAHQISVVRNYRCYGKVCCFKGFDSSSFSFNTKATPELFDQQFELFRRYVTLGIDLYAYATFTGPITANVPHRIAQFVDRLQGIHPNLPLRTVPLEIRSFSPMQRRLSDSLHSIAIGVQQEAIHCWNQEIRQRFSQMDRQRPIYEIDLSP